jgi:gliding motility-associated-like protein
MKKILILSFVLSCMAGISQVNLNFETGDFTGWTGRVGNTSTAGIMTAVGSPTIWTMGVNSSIWNQSYHTITTGAGTDQFGGFPIVAPGGSYSARLGGAGPNVNNGGACGGSPSNYVCPKQPGYVGPVIPPFSGAESLEQSFVVTPANAIVSLQYAAVFNNGSHSGGATVNPFFRAEVLNSSGGSISSCLTYTFVLNKTSLPPGSAQSGSSPCYYPAPSTSSVVVYMPWQRKIFDLTAQMGQTITVKFSSGGCDEGGHFGYAYIDASAGPKDLIQTGGAGCTGPVVLTGPTQYGSTYTWAGPAGGITAQAANTATVNTTGTYSLTVGSGPCAITFTTAVNLSPPSITAAPSIQTVCSGGAVSAVSFSPSAGATVNWTNTNTNVGIAASGSGNIGAYTAPTVTSTQIAYVTATPSLAGCTGPAKTFTIAINPYPNLTVGSNPTITCNSPTVPLTGSSTTSGTSYAWSPGGSAPTSTTTNVSAAGNYTITASVGSCSTQSVIAVTANTAVPTATAATSSTITCSSTSAVLTGSSTTSGVTYSWTPGGSAPTGTSTSVSGAGNYTLTITNPANGCKSTSIVNVTTNTTVPTTTASATGSISCLATSTSTLSGGAPTAATYTWTGPGVITGVNSSTATVTSPGNYTLAVTGTNGCTNTAVTSVSSNTTPPSPTASAGSNSITCSTTTVALTGGPASLTYTWTGPGFSGNTNSQNATATAPGNYTLAVTGANGCTNTAVTTVGTNTVLPSPTAASVGSVTCNTSTVALNGGPSALTYTWTGPGFSGSTNSQNATATATGNYTLTVTAANGCTNAAVTTVTSNTTPPVIASIGPDLNINCTSPTATLSGNSPTPGVTYSWTGPSGGTPAGTTPTNSTTIVSAGGNYTLTVTNPVNSCTASAVQAVSLNTVSPVVSTSTSNTITCLTTTATAIASTSSTPVSYTWTGPGITSGAGTATITTNQGGTYNYTVTDTFNNCTATGAVTVVSNTIQPTATTNNATLTCVNTSATLNGGPLSGVTYSWTGAGITSVANQADATVNAAGDYTLTTTAANGCTNTAVSTVSSDLSTSVADAGFTQTITCSSNSVTLNGSSTPSGTPNWLGGVCGSASSFTTTACAPGTYTLEVTNPTSGCTTTATVAVTSSTDVPQASVDNINTITCTNTVSTIGVTVNNPTDITYSWSGPGITGATNTATTTANVSGTYSIIITNTVTNCQSIYTANVPEDTTPVNASASPASSITCVATTATLSATPTGTNYGYTWTGPVVSGSNTANPIVNAGGDYEVTVTNTNNGCTGTYTVSVPTNTIVPTLTLSPSSVITTCAAPNVTLTATSSADPSSTYTWTAPSTGTIDNMNSSTPTAGGSGVFTVAVTNTVSGCISAVETVTVLADANTPTLTALASNTIICSGTAATLTVSGTDTYTWSPEASSSNSATISVTPTVTTTYSVEGTNTSSGCSNFTSVTINVTPTPTVGISSNVNAVCEGNSAAITLTGASSYTLTDPAVVTTGTAIVTPSVQTTYTVIGEASGCTSETQTLTIDVNTLPALAISSPTTCSGSPVTINASGADTYTWSTGDNTSTITVSPASNTTYSVSGTNTLTGCTSTVTTTDINVTPLPVASANANPNTVCTSGNIVLNAGSNVAGSTYTWTTGNGIDAGNQNQGTVTIPATTLTTGTYTYSLMVTSPEGCISPAASTTVSVIDLPNANFDLSDLSICQNSNGSLSINNPQTGVTYDWNIGGTFVNNANPANVPGSITSVTGTYTVSVVASISSCTNSATNTLTVNALPTVALVNYSATACENSSAGLEVLNPDGTYNYSWTYGSQTVGSGNNISVDPLTTSTTGMYTVTATDGNGCSNRTAGLIDIKPCETFVPEIFTPNGDGKNDGFEIRNIEYYPDNHLKIFNRWGNLVYQKDGYLNEFIGYSNTGDAAGKEKLPSGTYYVVLDWGDKKSEVYTGYLLLQY